MRFNMKQNKEQIPKKNLSFQIKSTNKVSIKILTFLTCKILKNKTAPLKLPNVKITKFKCKVQKLRIISITKISANKVLSTEKSLKLIFLFLCNINKITGSSDKPRYFLMLITEETNQKHWTNFLQWLNLKFPNKIFINL